MNKELKKLINTLAKKPDLAVKIKEIPDIKTLYEKCLKIVDGYTLNEFTQFLKKYNQPIFLEDDQLENVSGGRANTKFLAGSLLFASLLGVSSSIPTAAMKNNEVSSYVSQSYNIASNLDKSQPNENNEELLNKYDSLSISDLNKLSNAKQEEIFNFYKEEVNKQYKIYRDFTAIY